MSAMQDVLRQQARACAALDSPFMAQLLNGLADTWRAGSDLARICAGFDGDIGPRGASLPLRIAGGLHALVLSGRDPDLASCYPPDASNTDTLMTAVWAAIERHEDFFAHWMTSPPQTNEVRRSAVLIAAAHEIAARSPLPFVTSELGASAGLNLMWDRFALRAGATRFGPENAALTLVPDWSGPVPPSARITVTDRRGVDLNPLDAHDPDDVLRLLAYLWPDQPQRAALTRAAIAVQNAPVDRGDAIDWLERRLGDVAQGHLHLIYHTIAWQYFPEPRQRLGTALIEAAGARATPETPLAWLRFENDGGAEGAAISLRLWPGDLSLALGRADFHGRWVRWQT